MQIYGYHPSLGETVYLLIMTLVGTGIVAVVATLSQKLRGFFVAAIVATSVRGRKWVIATLQQRLDRCEIAAADKADCQLQATFALSRALLHGISALFLVVGAASANLMGAVDSNGPIKSSIIAWLFPVMAGVLYLMAFYCMVRMIYVLAVMSDLEKPGLTVAALGFRIHALKAKLPAK